MTFGQRSPRESCNERRSSRRGDGNIPLSNLVNLRAGANDYREGLGGRRWAGRRRTRISLAGSLVDSLAAVGGLEKPVGGSAGYIEER